MSMTPKQFQKYVDRDGCCMRCGTTEGLVPQHRINRGMGGSKLLDIPSNIIVFCGQCNGLIEADADAAAHARCMGWKMVFPESLVVVPIYDCMAQQWFFLDDEFHRTVAG